MIKPVARKKERIRLTRESRTWKGDDRPPDQVIVRLAQW